MGEWVMSGGGVNERRMSRGGEWELDDGRYDCERWRV